MQCLLGLVEKLQLSLQANESYALLISSVLGGRSFWRVLAGRIVGFLLEWLDGGEEVIWCDLDLFVLSDLVIEYLFFEQFVDEVTILGDVEWDLVWLAQLEQLFINWVG